MAKALCSSTSDNHWPKSNLTRSPPMKSSILILHETFVFLQCAPPTPMDICFLVRFNVLVVMLGKTSLCCSRVDEGCRIPWYEQIDHAIFVPKFMYKMDVARPLKRKKKEIAEIGSEQRLVGIHRRLNPDRLSIVLSLKTLKRPGARRLFRESASRELEKSFVFLPL